MQIFQLEHSRAVYRADFWIYGTALVVGVPCLFALTAPLDHLTLGLQLAAGVAAWSPLEYLLHRFVLHGLRPFSDWHALHHERPVALVASPTLFTLSLFFLLVWLPAAGLWGLHGACALTLGLMAGYLGYALTHHAMHHWSASKTWHGVWLHRQKLWHARHHHAGAHAGVCFGVTSRVWDRLFHSQPQPAR